MEQKADIVLLNGLIAPICLGPRSIGTSELMKANRVRGLAPE
jgi:hypothetical protein